MGAADPATVEALDNDPKDRHVAALALDSEATAVITLNVKDFKSIVLHQSRVAVLTPGVLVDRLLDEFADVVVTAV
jgi:predicted nucleic acid-binding protein